MANVRRVEQLLLWVEAIESDDGADGDDVGPVIDVAVAFVVAAAAAAVVVMSYLLLTRRE